MVRVVPLREEVAPPGKLSDVREKSKPAKAGSVKVMCTGEFGPPRNTESVMINWVPVKLAVYRLAVLLNPNSTAGSAIVTVVPDVRLRKPLGTKPFIGS